MKICCQNLEIWCRNLEIWGWNLKNLVEFWKFLPESGNFLLGILNTSVELGFFGFWGGKPRLTHQSWFLEQMTHRRPVTWSGQIRSKPLGGSGHLIRWTALVATIFFSLTFSATWLPQFLFSLSSLLYNFGNLVATIGFSLSGTSPSTSPG